MDVRVGPLRKLTTNELRLLNCGVGEDSWESLGLQGDQTSQSWRKSVLSVHWKDWGWSWNSNTLATWCEKLIIKNPDAGKDHRQEEKGTIEDEKVEWHHWLNGHEFEHTLGVGDGQGSLACYSPWGHKESDITEQLNWTELKKTCKFLNELENWILILFRREINTSQSPNKHRMGRWERTALSTGQAY